MAYFPNISSVLELPTALIVRESKTFPVHPQGNRVAGQDYAALWPHGRQRAISVDIDFDRCIVADGKCCARSSSDNFIPFAIDY